MDSQDPNPPGQTRDQQRRANRKLLYALLMMTAGAFAFGWALVPLYGVLCKVAGIGNVQAKEGQAVVLGFYFGIIALLIYRSHH